MQQRSFKVLPLREKEKSSEFNKEKQANQQTCSEALKLIEEEGLQCSILYVLRFRSFEQEEILVLFPVVRSNSNSQLSFFGRYQVIGITP